MVCNFYELCWIISVSLAVWTHTIAIASFFKCWIRITLIFSLFFFPTPPAKRYAKAVEKGRLLTESYPVYILWYTMNYAIVTTKVDPQTKKDAMKTADALGMPLSVVIKAFLKQFIRTKSVHFSMDLEEPTTKLLKSLQQSEKDKRAEKVISFNTGKEALDYLDTEIADERKNKRTSH